MPAWIVVGVMLLPLPGALKTPGPAVGSTAVK